tara:strand:+ start:2096 stop:3169 length:1074 start_codon:yes stop_codon:yes gene_type:complete
MTFEEDYMTRAIELAKKGRGNVSPNPIVGCVVVKDNNIIGEGYHEEYGKEHAEVNALKNCSESPVDADLYVTLEPCSIYSKTPPCVNEIITSSIKNVYIGTLDPNPKINGGGIEKLKKSGINIYEGILEKKCYDLNKGFFNWIKHQRPWVIVKIAQSKNGYMGLDSLSQTWITGKDSNDYTHLLRSKVDAVLIGRNTAEIDNPKLTVRNVKGVNPKRIILDTYRQLPLTLNIFNDNASDNIVFCSSEKFENSETPFCKYISVDEKSNKIDLNKMLDILGKEGVTSLLVEGGPEVISSFYNSDLIDEVYLYTSNNSLENATLKNPLNLKSDNWIKTETKYFENDELVIIRKKELCFQE